MIGFLSRALGRLLFASIFIMSAYHHFQDIKGTTKMIHPALHKLLDAEDIRGHFKKAGLVEHPTEYAAIAACVLMGAGGVFVATGLKPRIGCIFIIMFLVPATYFQHFLPMQEAKDEGKKMIEMIMVLKNVALMGAALMLFGYECEVASLRPKQLATTASGKLSKNKNIRKQMKGE
eukprot:TRINITY_DN62838_c0_g1_i1.p1 TRINITY_DN62838_c0_g1~~TRINITY_DN62838_c0_g1_i1.p1  ORF type:complete len:176 (-),score=53.06 TRINITY_DN62838_c0_g1_i1:246-773(-)